MPASEVSILRMTTAGAGVRVARVAARRDQRTTPVVRGSLAAVYRRASQVPRPVLCPRPAG
ncbi:MAG: hypothetical protein WB608_06330 [Terracidiphilus sp.]